jgi:hypothetical protein
MTFLGAHCLAVAPQHAPPSLLWGGSRPSFARRSGLREGGAKRAGWGQSWCCEECAAISHRDPHPGAFGADPPHKGEGKMRRSSGMKTKSACAARVRSIRFSFQIARETQSALRTRVSLGAGPPFVLPFASPQRGGTERRQAPPCLARAWAPCTCEVQGWASLRGTPAHLARCAAPIGAPLAAFSGRDHASWRD